MELVSGNSSRILISLMLTCAAFAFMPFDGAEYGIPAFVLADCLLEAVP